LQKIGVTHPCNTLHTYINAHTPQKSIVPCKEVAESWEMEIRGTRNMFEENWREREREREREMPAGTYLN
jgi:hypothetical protein